MLNLNLKDIKSRDFIFAFWSILFLVLPGILGIFLFNNELFFKLNWVTLSFLAGSITFPFVILNTIISDSLLSLSKEYRYDIFSSFLISSLVTGIGAYILIYLGYYFFDWSTYSLFKFAGIVEAIILIAATLKGGKD